MYIPPLNKVTDESLLYKLMERFSFATLIAVEDGVPTATHLPFVVVPPKDGENGKLVCHLARANPQWKAFQPNQEILVIFQGHHGYISPTWYEVHPSVPTWNYMVVHAYGVPHIVTDESEVRAALCDLVEINERHFDYQWDMETALPNNYFQQQIKAIVALEIPINRLEGKFKISQNRSLGDQTKVIEHLRQSNDPLERELAEIMQSYLMTESS